MMRDRAAVLDDIGDDVLAEIVARIADRRRRARSWSNRNFVVEHINAHAGQRHVGLARHGRRIFGFSRKSMIRRSRRQAMTPKPSPPRADFETADGHVGVLVDMLLQHLLIVHLVDVIAGEEHDIFGVVALEDVDILIDRVGGAKHTSGLPKCAGSPAGYRSSRCARAKEIPAALQMPDQAVRLVLRGDRDAADAGVQRIRQREIDDARSCRRNRPRAWRDGP